MSQDDSNHLIISSLLDELISNKLCLVETNVGRLINERFKELEQSLNQNISLLPVLRPSSRMQPIHQFSTAVPVTTSVQSLLVIPYPQQAVKPSILVASASYLTSYSLKQTPQLDRLDLSFPQPANKRFFLCLAGASVAVALLLWMGGHIKLGTDQAASPVLAMPQVSGQPAKEGTKQIIPSTQVTQPVKKIPVPANPQVTSHVRIPARVKPERVYVPARPPSPQKKKKIVSTQPRRIAYKSSLPAAVSSSPPKSIAPTTQTLLGVLEFGDRSAALVEINHVTRRINVGEMLTPGGWKLTKVVGQEAVLQRGDKLRSIYVGQKF